MKEKFITSIGGQALIEGVMMRGPEKTALAVRQPDGEIFTETWDTPKSRWYAKVPFIRGFFGMISSMIVGYKCLMKSAEIAGLDEEDEPAEPGKLEKWLSEKLKVNIMTIAAVIAIIIAGALSMFLFVMLPTFIGGFVTRYTGNTAIRGLVESLLKVAVFVIYLLLIAKMPDVKRVFEYHGGEHKTIACYEAGEELTVENVRTKTRLHPRCGTSFIFYTVVISIVVYSLISIEATLLRTAVKLLLMPFVMGFSYEIIRFAGRHDNLFTRIISKPGMMLQKITTKEPDDKQIEVAIASMKLAIPKEEGTDKW